MTPAVRKILYQIYIFLAERDTNLNLLSQKNLIENNF